MGTTQSTLFSKDQLQYIEEVRLENGKPLVYTPPNARAEDAKRGVFFLHYGRDSKEQLCDLLARALDYLLVPHFLDKRMKNGARSNVDAMRQALYDAKVVVIVCSHHMWNSKWVRLEINTALERHRQTQEAILLPIFWGTTRDKVSSVPPHPAMEVHPHHTELNSIKSDLVAPTKADDTPVLTEELLRNIVQSIVGMDALSGLPSIQRAREKVATHTSWAWLDRITAVWLNERHTAERKALNAPLELPQHVLEEMLARARANEEKEQSLEAREEFERYVQSRDMQHLRCSRALGYLPARVELMFRGVEDQKAPVDVDELKSQAVQGDMHAVMALLRCVGLGLQGVDASAVAEQYRAARANPVLGQPGTSLPSPDADTHVTVRAALEHNLRRMKLPGGVTDAGVRALAQGCPQLQHVNLFCCSKVTDAGVRALAQGCPQLQEVDLTQCSEVTDAGVRALAQGCPQLQHVDLFWCRKVTDAGVRALAQGCPQLQEVDLSECSEVTIAALKQELPAIAFH